MSEPLLTVRDVKSFYGNIMALKGVALDVHEGEIVTLIGANGAGKSTLMMTIFGNPRAREGRIFYRGRDITELPTHEIARMRIAQAPEGRRIFPRMTVRENLQMGAEIDALERNDMPIAGGHGADRKQGDGGSGSGRDAHRPTSASTSSTSSSSTPR